MFKYFSILKIENKLDFLIIILKTLYFKFK